VFILQIIVVGDSDEVMIEAFLPKRYWFLQARSCVCV